MKMASEGGGKIKSKKTQSANKPYDRNSSLFGKLKNSVKDLLIPSWLSGSSEESSGATADNSAQIVQAQASPIGNSAPSFGTGHESLGLQPKTGSGINAVEQPPQFIDLTQDHTDQSLSVFSTHGEGPNSLVGEPYIDASYGPAPNVNISTLDRQGGDWSSKKPDMPVTSNFPSLRSREHHSKKDDPVRLRMSDSYLDDTDDQDTGPVRVRPIMVSTGGLSRPSSSQQASKKQRIWSPEAVRRGKPLVPPTTKRPEFNSLLFGSPQQNDTTMFGESFRESSFYSGRTRYGGAAAERKKPLNKSLPYQSSLPLRKQVRANNMNSSFNATTSSTAQRILETLDRMSTPLGDARKIPQAESGNDSILSFTPSSYRRTSLLSSGRSVTRPLQIQRGPPTSQHQALSQAVIAKNRIKSSIIDRRQVSDSDKVEGEGVSSPKLTVSHEPAFVQRTGSTPAASQDQVSQLQPGSGMGKMKTKRFSQHVTSSRQTDDDEVVEVPNLRTDFTLPISHINPISLPSLSAKSNTIAATSIPSVGKSVPLKFTFSTPIEKRRPIESQSLNSTDKGFKFSSPIQASQTKTCAAGAEEGSKSFPEPAVGASSGVAPGGMSAAFPAPIPAWGSTAPKPKVSSPDIGGTSSSFKSYSKWGGFDKKSDVSAASDSGSPGFSLAPAASLKTGSVMDILGGGKSGDDLMAKFKKPPGTRECDSSMIANKPETTNCMACESPKAGAKQAPSGTTSGLKQAVNPATDDLMAKFKKPPGTWECSACMLSNKPEATKCIACETPKPGAKQTPSGTASTSSAKPALSHGSDDLMAKFKKPAGTWECDACMLSNKPEDTKCIACETPKPGAKQTPFGTDKSSNNSLAAMFKKPPGNWECDTCMVQNTASALRCIACDSPKPGLQSAGVVPKSLTSGSESSSAITISPGGGFTINTPATTTTTTGSGGFKFGNTATSSTAASSLPAPTGFVFSQTTNSKDSAGVFSTTPQSGFKFGVTSSGSDSSGTIVSSGFSAAKTSPGFVFGSGSSNASQAKMNDNASGFQFGETVKSNASDHSKSKSDLSSSGGIMFSQSGSLSNGNPATDLNKSNNFVSPNGGGFQFGSIPSKFAAPVSNVTVPSSLALATTGSATKPSPQQINFNFSSTGSAALDSTPAQSSDKPASNLFQFGAPTASIIQGTGLGMGKSLSENKPVMNGGFGSGLEVQSVSAITKPAVPDTTKQPAGYNFGGAAAPVFGSFGQPSVNPVTQSSQPGKRSVDFVEMGAPSAKKSLNAVSGNDQPSNGLFSFGGPGQAKATSFGSSATGSSGTAGGFVFGANSTQPKTQTSATAPTGGFQFNTGSNQPSSGFSFAFKGPNETSKTSFDISGQSDANKGSMSFSMAPNFNFGNAQSSSGTPFQFGGKAVENSTPAPTPGLIAFGGVSATGAPASNAGIGGPVGNFNIGSSDRKVKKAIRRIKK